MFPRRFHDYKISCLRILESQPPIFRKDEIHKKSSNAIFNGSADINSSGPHEQQATPRYVLFQHPSMMHVDDVSNIFDTIYREHRYLSQRIQSPSSNIPLRLLWPISQPLVAINEQRRNTRVIIATARGAISTSDDINSKRSAMIRNYISSSARRPGESSSVLMFTPSSVSSSRAYRTIAGIVSSNFSLRRLLEYSDTFAEAASELD
ncbi:hypothetical protein K0M31_007318 [Melipona bicolor]|uniref:Uncharacterized protein n=1 Tax=Melipona bicolor TaxID=60889 RepID=A0AA40KVL6_9HYME|nr:hypothetical protein K0M31_007318 [Melipona bicolor]